MKAICKQNYIVGPQGTPEGRLNIERGEIFEIEAVDDHFYAFRGYQTTMFAKESFVKQWNVLPDEPAGHVWVNLKGFSAINPKSFLIYDFEANTTQSVSADTDERKIREYTAENYGLRWIAAVAC